MVGPAFELPPPMKTYLLYGFLAALAGFLLQLVLFIAGLQSDPAKLTMGQSIGTVLGLVIAIAFLVLAIRARRSQVPASEEFGYGAAFGAGFGTQCFASLFSIATSYCYVTVINPHLSEIILRAQADKLAARGLSSDQIEQIQRMAGFMTSPAMLAATSFIGSLIVGTIIALVAAIFLKRASVRDPLAI